jgi:hypothetical protein
MIRTLTAFLAATAVLGTGGVAVAVQQDGSQARQERSSQPGSVVILRGLDKVTARTRDFEAPVGEAVEFGALGITVQYCRKRPPKSRRRCLPSCRLMTGVPTASVWKRKVSASSQAGCLPPTRR